MKNKTKQTKKSKKKMRKKTILKCLKMLIKFLHGTQIFFYILSFMTESYSSGFKVSR